MTFDAHANLPELRRGERWVIETLRVDHYEWFPWFPQGKVRIWVRTSAYQSGPHIMGWDAGRRAWKSPASIRRAALKILAKRAREELRDLRRRENPKTERSALKRKQRHAREEQKSAALAARDARWIGEFPPKRLEG